RKRAPDMGVHALAQELERRRLETLTRRDQPIALGLPPGFQLVGGHAPEHTTGDLASRQKSTRGAPPPPGPWRTSQAVHGPGPARQHDLLQLLFQDDCARVSRRLD